MKSNTSNLVNNDEKASYCFNTMSRIETMKKAIIQTEKLVNKTKESVEIELNEILKNSKIAADLQRLTVRIRMLKDQLDKERSEYEALKKKSSFNHLKINNLNNPNLSNLPNSLNSEPSISSFIKELDREIVIFDQEKLEKDKQSINKIENEIKVKTNLLKEINRSLDFVERKLIGELYQMFPIKESTGKYTILNYQLPDLNDQLEDEERIKISLGYCSHLLITLSKILDLPLKHRIQFNGSQSWILNSNVDNPRLKDSKYPLFLNKDRFKFNVGIYLLNENIVQLRHHFNLHTNDQKKLSQNLFSLFNDKLLLEPEINS